MILFNGISSDEVGVIVEHYPKIVFPKRHVESYQVPGRNGEIIFDRGTYDNYEQTYEVFFDSKRFGGLNAALPRIASWLLSGVGYQRLEDSYFPDYYRMAYVEEVDSFLSYFNEYGQGVLKFNCAPERWYKTGEAEIEIQNGTTLYNPSGFKAFPLIRIQGTYSYSIYFHFTDKNGTRDVTFNTSYFSGSYYIDAKERTVYRISSSNGAITYEDPTVYLGKFEEMYLGDATTLSWEISNGSPSSVGSNPKICITPRWWTI